VSFPERNLDPLTDSSNYFSRASETSSKKKKMSSTEDSDHKPASDEEEAEDVAQSESSDDESGSEKEEDEEKEDGSNSARSSDEDEKPKAKRRKRIKQVASSDDEDGNDKSKSGRKNIRKLIKADKLDVSTKEAAKIERDRKQRIEERQKLYNQFYDERPEEAKEITKLVLDFNEKTKKPLLEVDKTLVRKLKPHQANGVKFMWDACFESLERCETETGSGCILAHCKLAF